MILVRAGHQNNVIIYVFTGNVREIFFLEKDCKKAFPEKYCLLEGSSDCFKVRYDETTLAHIYYEDGGSDAINLYANDSKDYVTFQKNEPVKFYVIANYLRVRTNFSFGEVALILTKDRHLAKTLGLSSTDYEKNFGPLDRAKLFCLANFTDPSTIALTLYEKKALDVYGAAAREIAIRRRDQERQRILDKSEKERRQQEALALQVAKRKEYEEARFKEISVETERARNQIEMDRIRRINENAAYEAKLEVERRAYEEKLRIELEAKRKEHAMLMEELKQRERLEKQDRTRERELLKALGLALNGEAPRIADRTANGRRDDGKVKIIADNKALPYSANTKNSSSVKAKTTTASKTKQSSTSKAKRATTTTSTAKRSSGAKVKPITDSKVHRIRAG